MRHVTVYREADVYAGWPANHGAWQWGDEFLVGFMRGRYERGYMHNIHEPFEKVLARSLDGGETWNVENPGVNFEAAWTEAPPSFDLEKSIIRVCGRYDHGGEYCAEGGGFYVSHDRGKFWHGGYGFAGLEQIFGSPNHCTSRTRVLGNLVFLSAAKQNHWGSDWIFVARHDGERFHAGAVICDDGVRAVMPAVERLGDRIIVVARRRGPPRQWGWVDAFVSDDGGESWRFTSQVGVTGQDNGNPPALIASSGKLFCAYANRTEKTVDVSVSDDAGETWTGFAVLRKGDNSDVGYPQLFKRADGQLACVYYWSEFE